jgi:uroporphyrinogen decarboxylase
LRLSIGIEQGTDLRVVLAGLPDDVAIQGNLDPNLLLGDQAEMIDAALAILKSVPMTKHVFNLGHGILPGTDPARVTELVSMIRRFDETGV